MRCEYCGNEISVGREYCDVCGMPKEDSVFVSQRNEEKMPAPDELPPQVRYDSWGRLTWNYIYYNRKREKMFLRYTFDEEYLVCYPPAYEEKKRKLFGRGTKNTEKRSEEGDGKVYYFYEKITRILQKWEEDAIWLVHGDDRVKISVSHDQYEFILEQLMLQCPDAEVV